MANDEHVAQLTSGVDVWNAWCNANANTRPNLSGANLDRANLSSADLRDANLGGANLHHAVLGGAILVRADLSGANLSVTTGNEPKITVDNIEVVQFIYLMLHNQKIREVIDTITSKAVLILGRFTDERKAVLDALREELRKHNYLPILFDFELPERRNKSPHAKTRWRLQNATIQQPRALWRRGAFKSPFGQTGDD